MSGPKSTAHIAGDGCTWMPVRRHGMLLCSTLKVCSSSLSGMPFFADTIFRLEQETLILHRILCRRVPRCNPTLCPQPHRACRTTQQVLRGCTHAHPSGDQDHASQRHGQEGTLPLECRRHEGRCRPPQSHHRSACLQRQPHSSWRRWKQK